MIPVRSYRQDQKDAGAGDPWFEAWHGIFRPRTVKVESSPLNSDAQRKGKDRLLHQPDGSIIAIEEKFLKRFRNNLFIEHVMSDSPFVPGWIEQDLECDYLAVGYPRIRTCIYYPWKELQDRWFRNKAHYRRRFGDRFTGTYTYNRRYKSVCTPVPNILLPVERVVTLPLDCPLKWEDLKSRL